MAFPFLQLLINSLISGSIYALVAVGFSLIYTTNRFMHFAHGAVIIATGYILLSALTIFHLPLIISILLTLILTSLLGWSMYKFIYEKLLAKKSSTVILLIAGIGLLILLENIIVLLFGPQVRTLGLTPQLTPQTATQTTSFTLGNAIITSSQTILIVTVILLLCSIYWLMKKTTLGKQLRATADNPELASIIGLDVNHLRSLSFILGSFLAGIAGILIAIEQNLSPLMGTMLMVKGFSGAVIGGMLSVPGSILGSYIVGLAEHFGTWYISSGYKDAITFGLLFLFLLLRPQGLLGKNKGVKQ